MKSCPFWAHNVPARIDYLAIDEHTTGQTGTHNVKKTYDKYYKSRLRVVVILRVFDM